MIITLEPVSIPVLYLANQPMISKESLFQFRAPFPNPHPLCRPFGRWGASNGTTFYSFFLIGERSKPQSKNRMERYLILPWQLFNISLLSSHRSTTYKDYLPLWPSYFHSCFPFAATNRLLHTQVEKPITPLSVSWYHLDEKVQGVRYWNVHV